MISRAIHEAEQQSDELFKSMGVQMRPADEDDSASDVGDMEDLEHETVQLVPAEERRLVSLSSPDLFEQHRLSGTLHFILDDHKFACGRIRGANYLEPMVDSVHDEPLCEQCRRNPAVCFSSRWMKVDVLQKQCLSSSGAGSADECAVPIHCCMTHDLREMSCGVPLISHHLNLCMVGS